MQFFRYTVFFSSIDSLNLASALVFSYKVMEVHGKYYGISFLPVFISCGLYIYTFLDIQIL